MSGRGRGKRVKGDVASGAMEDTVKTEARTSEARTSEAMTTEARTSESGGAVAAPKKTKKKQFPVVAIITPDGIEGNLLMATKRPLVVHLPIQSRDVPMNDMPIMYNPLPPTEAEPYDSYAENPFHEELEVCVSSTSPVPVISTPSSVPSGGSDTRINTAAAVAVTGAGVGKGGAGAGAGTVEENDFYRMKGTFLVKFKNASDVKTLPATSDAACFWCCHTFAHRPVVLPIRDTGDHLLVMGNFCCPECACAYLFDMRQDAHTRWEQQALLYRVYGEACRGSIHPAPHRTLLKMFGGTLSIEQYRMLIRSHKVRVDIHLPPMVSILSTMDTKPIDFYDASLTKNVNETVTERLQKAEEVLRLRRTKPLKAWESTLDACINLKIKYEGSTLSLDS